MSCFGHPCFLKQKSHSLLQQCYATESRRTSTAWMEMKVSWLNHWCKHINLEFRPIFFLLLMELYKQDLLYIVVYGIKRITKQQLDK